MDERFVDLESVVDLSDIIDALQDLSAEELLAHGLTADSTWDEIDDPVLLGPDGLPIETWREGYPYSERMSRSEYETTKRLLQIELLKAQAWIRETGQKLVVVFEGRDAAGKGGTIKRFTEHLNPRGTSVVALSAPTDRERGQWYFQRYVQHLPARGEIVLFDRSWYNSTGVERVMGFCTEAEYEEFLRRIPEFEPCWRALGPCWSSCGSRCHAGNRCPVHHSAYRPGTAVEAEPYGLGVVGPVGRLHGGEGGHVRPPHEHAPWTVVRSNDKSAGEAIRLFFTSAYPDKDDELVGSPDPLIVGPPPSSAPTPARPP